MSDSRSASIRQYSRIQDMVSFQSRIINFLGSIIIAFGGTYLLQSPALDTPQVYVLFLLILSVCLWVTEAIPPFTVGLFIFGFLVFALGKHYHDIDPTTSNKIVQKYVQTWSNSVIWLMLGGFFMAEAMQKVGLDRTIFKLTIKRFGTKPRYVLLGIMLVTAIFSMIMSNTATTAMMIAAVLPFLKTLPKDAKITKALLIGIPAAASLGGMGTIIGSPPNAVAVDGLLQNGIKFGFLEWMMIGFPTAIVLVLIFWFIMISKFIPKVSTIDLGFLSEGEPEEGSTEKIFVMKKKFVLGVLIVTMLLWLTGKIHGISASTVSMLPIMLLTMFRIVNSEDVRKLPWDTLMLVAGGLSLGLAIKETGLAAYYVGLLNEYSLNGYVMIGVFALITVVLSNFMSNTATTTILIPIAIILATDNPIILPLVIGFSASTALFFPISTPPNAIAFSTGLITQKDFRFGGLIAGLLGPIIVVLVILGFQLLGLI
ncbi:sodium-dependent dicarboxylate transporter 2/3/5 [Wenyingzhuangia heitensis]|uniref:Sodium-dependent dicarboxylate transporter 2/3/5 n=1 Tax=Wenyingzhuangia heitensis TaxID=1487859 RepID=A0ABX0U942_9FLAO|nr:DASS family sodium-coupled anion symporter [Wenyingzhuangia heitensis]NIJ43636.1 sodium-dependent dicarboxylate transporter 2/3/5 [Wenyingzhuangia heitensis]